MNEYFVIGQAGTPVAKTAAPAAQKTTTATQSPVQAPKQKPQGGFNFDPTIVFIVVIAAMFFMMWRGQSKERKRREEMLNSLKAGDKVITAGGLYGVIDSVTEETFKIRIADNVKIEVSRASVNRREETENKDDAKK